MARRLSLLVLVLVAATVLAFPPADRPLPPREAPLAMNVPDGFKVTLFAGEPDVVQPIAFCFDDRGRLWVCECRSYPKWIKDGSPGEDRILIFEDTKNTGTFDKRTVFADKLANLSSIEFGFGGVFVTCAPNLLHIPLDPATDQPAGPPTVLLDGWSLKIQHNIVNGLKWGPDGWLYGCHGILDTSRVGIPGTSADKRVPINCGVWRYQPVTRKFEAVAHGTTNPWGIDWDENGELYLTNCVIEHAFHVIPGGHYQRMYGNDLDPDVYKLMGACVDHLHWGGGHWTSSRGGQGKHSEAGGGHAHSGCMVYQGSNFPEKYRNCLYTCNIHGNRVNRDWIYNSPKGPVLRHDKDFLMANDSWFRGIAINYGPDGGVYVSDWCDTGECHNYQVVDKTNGRIYKVVHGQVPEQAIEPGTLSLVRWTEKGSWNDEWRSKHQRRLIQEMVAAGKLTPKTVRADVLKVLSTLQPGQTSGKFRSLPVVPALRLLYTAKAVDGWSAEDYAEMTGVGVDPIIQAFGWAGRLEHAAEHGAIWKDNVDSRKHEFFLDGVHRLSRVAIASRMQRLSPEMRWYFAFELVKREDDADDPQIPLLLWYAIEPLPLLDPARAVSLLEASKIPLIREFIARRLASADSTKKGNLDLILRGALNKSDAIVHRDVLAGILAAFDGQRDHAMPAAWNKAYPIFAESSSAEVRDLNIRLAVLFGDARALDSLRSLVEDRAAEKSRRESALKSLVFKMPAGLQQTLDGLLDDTALRSPAIKALARFDDAKIPPRLLGLYGKLPPGEREDIRQTLASRPAFALALLDAVAKDQVDRKDLSTVIVRQMLALKDKRVVERVTEVWGTIRPVAERKTELTAKYKKLLTADAIKTADPARGKAVYVKNCAACHKLFGEGGTVGPDLTGSQRANLEYVLENVLDPSAVVAKEYQVTVIATTAGRTVTGIVKMETDKTLTVQMANETLVLAKDDIESRVLSPQSMMPEGILEQLPLDDVRALVNYLARSMPLESASPVP